jgi:uncharacterized repeat protein (TIGR02543 family)
MPSDASNKAVSWTSSAPAIATVDVNGKVDAKAEGTAKITVTTADGGFTSDCNVIVEAADPNAVTVTAVSLDKTTLVLTIGGSETLTPTVLPTNATNKNVSWASSNANVATVDNDGKVEAKATGTAIITVTTQNGGKTATCTVTVSGVGPGPVAVTGVSLNTTALSLVVGDSETLSPTVLPENASNKALSWTSNAPAVATVNTNGKVEAKAIGTAIITVTTTDGGKTAECTITVTPTPVSIAVLTQPEKTRYVVGEELNLTGLVVTAVFTEGTPEIITITAANITGFDTSTAGNKTVIITYGGRTATFTVTVVEVSKIEITRQPDKTRYAIGDGLDLTGLVVTATYSDGVTESVAITASNIIGFDSSAFGEKTITVIYGSKTTTFTITVVTVVTLNPNGGNWNNDTANKIVEAEWNTIIVRPSNPRKDGSSFGGWYRDNNTFNNPWNFITDTVTGNITLYANWLIQNDNTDDFELGASSTNTFNVATTAEWDSALTTISSGGNDKNYIINVTDDFTVAGRTTASFGAVSGLKVSIRGEGRTLTLSGNGRILQIAANQTVILRDVALKGRGASVNNNTYLVYVLGTFIMNGGEISGNKNYINYNYSSASVRGGGIYMDNGTFIMNSGKISGNQVDVSGASPSDSYGGGVYVGGTAGNFTMNGGEISGNTAKCFAGNNAYAYGGGVSLSSGTFTMNGGEISGNTANSSSNINCAGGGGGVYAAGTFIMSGGEISGNTVRLDGTVNYNLSGGGGVYNSGTFSIITGTIYGSNEATGIRNTTATNSSGAALYVNAQYGTFSGTTWNKNGDLDTTNNTIKVVNGNLQ